MRGNERIYAPRIEATISERSPFGLGKTNTEHIFDVGPALHTALIGTPEPVGGPQDKGGRERRSQ
jgi:hypothetical protein